MRTLKLCLYDPCSGAVVVIRKTELSDAAIKLYSTCVRRFNEWAEHEPDVFDVAVVEVGGVATPPARRKSNEHVKTAHAG